jgi:hypothetical protein
MHDPQQQHPYTLLGRHRQVLDLKSSNKSTSRLNPGNMSPIKVLAGKAPSPNNIVEFGSTRMVFRDSTSKKNRIKR